MPTKLPEDAYGFPASALVGLTPTEEAAAVTQEAPPQETAPSAPPPVAAVDDYPLAALEGLTPTESSPVGNKSIAPLPTDVAQEKPFGQWLKEDSPFGPGKLLGPRNVGAVVGGLLTAPGGPAMVGGSTLGGMAGEALERYWQSTDEKPFVLEEEQNNIMRAGRDEAIGSLVGGVFTAGVGKILAPFAKRIDASRAASNAIAKRKGIPLSAGEQTGSPFLLAAEEKSKQYPVIGRAGRAFEKWQTQGMEEALDKTIRDIDPGYREAAEKVGQAVKKGSRAAFKLNTELVDTMWDGVGMILKPDARFSLWRVNRLADGPETGPVLREMGITNRAGMSFEKLREVQKGLLQRMGETVGTPQGRGYGQVYQAFDEDLGQLGARVPGLGNLVDKVRQLHRTRIVQTFVDNKAYRTMQEADASTLVSTLFPRGVSVEEVRRIKSVLPKEAYNKLKAGWIANVSGVVEGQGTKGFSPGELLWNTGEQFYRPGVMKEILGPDYQEFRGIREIFARTSRAREAGMDVLQKPVTKSQAARLTELGVKGGAAYAAGLGLQQLGINPTTAALVTGLSAYGMSQLLFSRAGRRWLGEGLKLNPFVKVGVTRAVALPVAQEQAAREWPFIPYEVLSAPVFERGQQLSTPVAPAP